MNIIRSIILNFIFSSTLAATFVIEVDKSISEEKLRNLNSKDFSIEKFDSYSSSYFDRLYTVTTKEDKDQISNHLASDVKIIEISEVSQIEAMGLDPATSNTRLKDYNDSLIKYQWAIASQGQEIFEDITDIDHVTRRDNYNPNTQAEIEKTLALLANTDLPIEVINTLLVKIQTLKNNSVPSDVNIVPILDKLSSLVKKEVSVAVIDSGVDIGHKEITSSIKKNLIECNEQGQISATNKEDKDRNGLPGDCMGWNFTAALKSPFAKFPHDNSGHGTHVAGIIAAAGNNETGVIGVSDKIKILPIKVLFEDESSENATLIAFSDRLARGILYAIKSKVDVINLSLGWHKVLDTTYLRNAIAEATNAGITVVAAAGNNNTKSRIYPCAYPNVICVGATSINSQVAEFSNFGGAVDIFAPGDNILSLHTYKSSPIVFSQLGYEIRSGTSQATPFVSSAVALLKSIYPEITLSEIKARLFSSAKKLKDKKSGMLPGLFGRLDIAASIQDSPKNQIIPLFKLVDEVPYRVSTKRLGFNLPIQSLIEDVENVKVSISASDNKLKFAKDHYVIEQIEASRAYNLPIEASLDNLDIDREVTIKVSIIHQDREKIFEHRINLVRVLVEDPALEEIEVKFNNSKKPLFTIKNNKISPLIQKIDQYNSELSKMYFLRKNTQDGILLTLFKNTKDQLIEQAKEIQIEKDFTFNNAKVLDIDLDGDSEIFIQKTKTEDNKPITYISYFTEEGEPLLDGKQMVLKESYFDFNNTIKFLNYNHESLGKIKLPVFLSLGTLPEDQQPQGFFATKDTLQRVRLYLLSPTVNDEEIALKTIALDTEQFYKELKTTHQLYWNSDVKIISLTQHDEKLILTLAAGDGISKKLYQYSISSDFKLIPYSEPTRSNLVENDSAVLTRNFVSGTKDISMVGFIDQNRARISFFEDGTLESDVVNIDKKSEYFEGHIANFISDNAKYSIFQTNQSIYIAALGQQKNIFSKRIEKFDFIPGQSFSQFFNETTLHVNGEKKAALYLDSSALGTNSVHVLSLEKDRVTESARLSFLVPPNCRIFGSDVIEDSSRINLLCLERNRSHSFKVIKLDY